MTKHSSDAPDLSIAQILLPQWFLDLDGARKPYAIVVIVMLGLIPLLVLAVVAANDLKLQTDALAAILAQPEASLAEIRTANAAIHEDYRRYAIGAVGGILWATLIAVGGARITAQVAVDWISTLTNSARRVADGELGVVIARDNDSQIGDIQESLGKMVASFRATITRIERAASELNESAMVMAETSDSSGRAISDVAQSINLISEGTSHQVALIAAASGFVAQIESAVLDTASNAAAAQRESAQTQELTETGVDRATEIQTAMEIVRNATQSTVEMVRSLSETSANIDEIVRSITAISGQTNLLALNAAIEAARAGEQGRGFAVVAEEVRKLAEDSQSSAEGIADLIDSIQVQTVQAVAAIEAGMVTVERGFEAVNHNRQLFFDISGEVRMFHEGSAEIAALARTIASDAGRVRERIEEVASVAEQSSASTEQVSAATQQTSASSQQLTAAAQRVSQTAVSLKELAGRFSANNVRSGA